MWLLSLLWFVSRAWWAIFQRWTLVLLWPLHFQIASKRGFGPTTFPKSITARSQRKGSINFMLPGYHILRMSNDGREQSMDSITNIQTKGLAKILKIPTSRRKNKINHFGLQIRLLKRDQSFILERTLVWNLAVKPKTRISVTIHTPN